MSRKHRNRKSKPTRKVAAPTVAVVSLGCVKNLVDTEKMLGSLAEDGFLVGAEMDEADVILINTCGFLASARDEGRAAIEQAAETATATGAKVVVAGCWVQHAPAEVWAAGSIDAALPLGERDRIAEVCRNVLADSERKPAAEVEPFTAMPDDAGRLLLTPPHVAYLRITEGCDNRCGYCTIPAIRGPLRTKSVDAVLEEADGLLAGGVKELILIGQDTTAWGVDLFGSPSLERLLDPLIERVGPNRWLRVLYTHPLHWTEALVERFASGPPLLGYVDLPIQHIDADILQRMNRKVTPEQIEQWIETLRRRVPGITLRTTMIAGLPGETDAAFARLVEFVKRMRFDHLGAFAYSPEAGTAAAGMDDQIPEDVKAERLAVLMATQQEIAFARGRQRVDDAETAPLLIDARTGNREYRGRFAHQAPDVDGATFLLAKKADVGSLVEATVVGVDEYDLIAKPAPPATQGIL